MKKELLDFEAQEMHLEGVLKFALISPGPQSVMRPGIILMLV